MVIIYHVLFPRDFESTLYVCKKRGHIHRKFFWGDVRRECKECTFFKTKRFEPIKILV